jgi:hypothetical protein
LAELPWQNNIKGIYCSFSESRSGLRRSYSRSASRLQLGKAPNRLYIYGRLGSQARKALATRREKLLRSTCHGARYDSDDLSPPTSGISSIVCQASIRYMSDIFQILTYARYIPGIYLHAKGYDFIGFNACIHSIGRVHWYIEACKEER